MAQFIWNTVLPLVGTFALGVAGWFAANFYGEPLSRFAAIRREILVAIFFYANVNKDTQRNVIEVGASELRRLAAQLDALRNSLMAPTSWTLSRMAFDLPRAVRGVTGLSNTLVSVDGQKALHRHEIELALRFTPEFTSAEIEAIRARSERLGQ